MGTRTMKSMSVVKLDDYGMRRGFCIGEAKSQLQQREALSPHHCLKTMPNLLIPCSHFHVPTSSNVHPNIWLLKVVRCNMASPLLEHIIKWESIWHMDGYYVVGVTAISYSRYICIIIIVSNEEKAYIVSTVDNPQCTCLDFGKCHQWHRWRGVARYLAFTYTTFSCICAR